MIVTIIIIILLLFVVIVNNFRLANVNEKSIDDLFGNTMLSIIIGALLLGIILSMGNEPRAIDVYRNKTALEITSVNGVPRDTVVVWKNN